VVQNVLQRRVSREKQKLGGSRVEKKNSSSLIKGKRNSTRFYSTEGGGEGTGPKIQDRGIGRKKHRISRA